MTTAAIATHDEDQGQRVKTIKDGAANDRQTTAAVATATAMTASTDDQHTTHDGEAHCDEEGVQGTAKDDDDGRRQERTGQERRGQDRTGKDRREQDRTGRDGTGKGRAVQGQDW